MTTARVDYGLDVPGVVRTLATAGVLSLTAGGAHLRLPWLSRHCLALVATVAGLGAGALCLSVAAFGVWLSRVAKLRERDRLLAGIPWRGDEMVLDVGCGRGLLLIGAAKRLTSGTAIGVDLWDRTLESGNRPAATWANARAEGVADRIAVRDGDARCLPLNDRSCDVVVSSLMLHHLTDPRDRERAVREMARVLKPGGHLAILDVVGHAGADARVLAESGVERVRRAGPRALLYCTVTGRRREITGVVGQVIK